LRDARDGGLAALSSKEVAILGTAKAFGLA
jgi:hypothetical protein